MCEFLLTICFFYKFARRWHTTVLDYVPLADKNCWSPLPCAVLYYRSCGQIVNECRACAMPRKTLSSTCRALFH